jgi:hypothetical protein
MRCACVARDSNESEAVSSELASSIESV